MGLYYKPEDGTIEDWIEWSEDKNIPVVFKGYEALHQLWDKGYIFPGRTYLRINWSECSDNHYLILGRNVLEGIDVPVHGGIEGLHLAEKILSEAPNWDIYRYNPEPMLIKELMKHPMYSNYFLNPKTMPSGDVYYTFPDVQT